MNCLQNLTSRIAGVDNEQMTNRVIGMGAMMGFGLGAIKEQFKTPSQNNMNAQNTTYNTTEGTGLKGFVNRAKSIIMPNMNLSDEKDYNGNVNPIRNVMQTNKTIENNNLSNNTNDSKLNIKSVASNIAKTGFKGAKSYLAVGAKMAEGNFVNNPYKNSVLNKKNTFQNTGYINKIATNKLEKLGDNNEFEKDNQK